MPRPTLPHAPPMHWIDEASLSADGNGVVAMAEIATSHPFLENGVLVPAALIEFLAQAAAAGHSLRAMSGQEGRRIKRGMLAAMRDFWIHDEVRVGDALRLVAGHEMTLGTLSMARVEAYARSPGEARERFVAEGRMTFHLEFV